MHSRGHAVKKLVPQSEKPEAVAAWPFPNANGSRGASHHAVGRSSSPLPMRLDPSRAGTNFSTAAVAAKAATHASFAARRDAAKRIVQYNVAAGARKTMPVQLPPGVVAGHGPVKAALSTYAPTKPEWTDSEPGVFNRYPFAYMLLSDKPDETTGRPDRYGFGYAERTKAKLGGGATQNGYGPSRPTPRSDRVRSPSCTATRTASTRITPARSAQRPLHDAPQLERETEGTHPQEVPAAVAMPAAKQQLQPGKQASTPSRRNTPLHAPPKAAPPSAADASQEPSDTAVTATRVLEQPAATLPIGIACLAVTTLIERSGRCLARCLGHQAPEYTRSAGAEDHQTVDEVHMNAARRTYARPHSRRARAQADTLADSHPVTP